MDVVIILGLAALLFIFTERIIVGILSNPLKMWRLKDKIDELELKNSILAKELKDLKNTRTHMSTPYRGGYDVS